MRRIEETLVPDKDTKRTIRYASLNDSDPVSMVYIEKTALGVPRPDRLKLIIEIDG